MLFTNEPTRLQRLLNRAIDTITASLPKVSTRRASERVYRRLDRDHRAFLFLSVRPRLNGVRVDLPRSWRLPESHPLQFKPRLRGPTLLLRHEDELPELIALLKQVVPCSVGLRPWIAHRHRPDAPPEPAWDVPITACPGVSCYDDQRMIFELARKGRLN